MGRYKFSNKNLDVITLGLILAVSIIFFGNQMAHQNLSKSQATRGVASSQADAEVLADEGIGATGKEPLSFLDKTQSALGGDAAGISAFNFFQRQLSAYENKAEDKDNQICMTQESCPLPIKEVYEVGLARLDKANLPAAKEALQTSLINSDLSLKDKQTIIAQHLIGTNMHNVSEVSVLKENDEVEISPAAQYILVTAKQLQILKVPENEYLQIMYRALAQSKDPVAKKLILQGLAKGHPSHKQEIESVAKKMGISILASR